MPLIVNIDGDTSGLDDSINEASGGMEVFGKSVNLKGVASMTALAGAAGVAAAAVVKVTQAAAADRDETAALALTIENATGSTEDYTAATDAAIAAGQAKAFTDSEVRAGLSLLVGATGNVSEATDALTIAQDLARLSGEPLEETSRAVTEALGGEGGALKELIPGLEESEDATVMLQAAQDAAAGSADLFAESSAGAAARTQEGFAELTETLGSAFLPILDALLPALIPILELLTTLLEAVLPLIIPLIENMAKKLELVVTVVTKVSEVLASMIAKIQEAIKYIQDLISKIDIIPDINLPSLPDLNPFNNGGGGDGTDEAQSRAYNAAASTNRNAVPGVTINIVGDPQTIERTVIDALRTYNRRNGLFSWDSQS